MLVDGHPMTRERLALLIDDEDDLEVVGAAGGAGEARGLLAERLPDVLVLDLSLGDAYGIEFIKELRQLHPKLRILVCSMHDQSVYAERALRAGAKGYVTKQEATKWVLLALRRILGGGVYLSEEMSQAVLGRVTGGGRGGAAAEGATLDALTDRELEVFQLIGAGKPVARIAKLLHISPKTVGAHREHVKTELGVKTAAELLRLAVQMTVRGEAWHASREALGRVA